MVVIISKRFIDTDMARGVQAPKTRPEVVAQQALAAVKQGLEEVLADEMTRNVKRGLGAEQASYLKAHRAAWSKAP